MSRSEKLPLDLKKAVVVGGICRCGMCGAHLNLVAKPSQCPDDACRQNFEYIVVAPGAGTLTDPWLPMYSHDVVPAFVDAERPPTSHHGWYKGRPMATIALNESSQDKF